MWLHWDGDVPMPERAWGHDGVSDGFRMEVSAALRRGASTLQVMDLRTEGRTGGRLSFCTAVSMSVLRRASRSFAAERRTQGRPCRRPRCSVC